MRSKVQKWGNSLAIRLPKAAAERIGLKERDAIEITVDDEKVAIVPIVPRDYQLKDLLKEITNKNLHKEEDFGPAMGREML